MVSRVLCLHLPFFPVERLERSYERFERAAFCVYQKQGRHLRILGASEKARLAGVRAFMTVTEAAAVCPDLESLPLQDADDQKELTNLAHLLQDFAPRVGLYGRRSILAFLGQDSRYFGGEHQLLDDALSRVRDLAYSVRGVIASTPAAAYALGAFGAKEALCVEGEEEEESLGALPVMALRPQYREFEWLEALGLRTLAQVFALPKRDLELRFPRLPNRLAALKDGDGDEDLQRVRGTLVYEENFEFDHPLRSRPRLLKVLGRLLERIYARLQKSRGPWGVRKFLLNLDGDIQTLAFRRACMGAAQALVLMENQLESLRFQNPVEKLYLKALEIDEDPGDKGQLFGGGEEGVFEDFLDRLSSRLGQENLCWARLQDDHRPERCFEFLPFAKAPGPQKNPRSGLPYRPLRLYPRAMKISIQEREKGIWHLRGSSFAGRLEQSLGPERIRYGFWDQLVDRDYYRVKTKQGVWLWIFQDRQSQEWYEHGIFD
ncbi:MAG: hypothetical protein P1V97_16840 [Planctomycetota bacterium]|nr:hypothetical protein [Planctomycetota bacterium]